MKIANLLSFFAQQRFRSAKIEPSISYTKYITYNYKQRNKSPGINIAKYGIATQKSTAHQGFAEKAIDGSRIGRHDTFGGFSIVDISAYHWFQI